MFRIFKIRRKTKNSFITNSWALGGGWNARVTFIDLLIFNVKLFNLHKYYITYRNKFIKL